MPVTFVIPPITQVLMDSVFSAVQNLVVAFRDVIDELTANDIALFSTLADECNMRINAGRLMSKDVREPRDFERTRYIAAPSIVGDNALLDFFASQEVRVELDPICRVQDGKEMPPGMSCALYDKWCYVSTGNICESASIYRDVTQKFRPSAPCACECLGFASRIDGESGNSYFRHGKTIYAYQPHAHIIDAADVRIIEQPLFDDLFACDATDEAFEQDRW